jgi:PPOX class probable F420-dependent enzyme
MPAPDSVIPESPIPDSPIPDSHRDLLDKPVVWHIATIGPKGGPQSNPVWIGPDEEGNLLFSCTKPRQKYKNLMANPAIALSATDPDDSDRYLEVRGTVIRIDDDPGGTFLDIMSKKYRNQDVFSDHDPVADTARVVIVIRPEHTTT